MITSCEFSLNKSIEILSLIIVIAVFHENNKYYPQAFFIWMSI